MRASCSARWRRLFSSAAFAASTAAAGLRDLRTVVVVFQAHQLVALPNRLIVVHFHVAHEPRDLRAKRRDIAANERVVGDLIDAPSFPRVPVARQCERDSERHQHDEHGACRIAARRSSAD
jgi:hypothetical protein